MAVLIFEQHKGCSVMGFDTGTHVEIDRHGYLKVRGNTTEHFLHMQRHQTIAKKSRCVTVINLFTSDVPVPT